MYQSFKPKSEGAIFAKRSKPQGAKKLSSRHLHQLGQTGGIWNIQVRKEREENERAMHVSSLSATGRR
jgi:hypothetical protein